jgi:hypothetical protein
MLSVSFFPLKTLIALIEFGSISLKETFDELNVVSFEII